MGSLSSKNALVTGSTSGIGLAIARAFAAEGANVTINGLGDAAAIEQERAGIEKDFGVKCRYSDANMMDGAAVTAMIHEAEEAFGSL
ncbi:SDR family NAD(P)-dependent oxidoreductase, partial [Mesorhizobium sp. M2A.F.Ca.ET.040.01.1.1]